MRRSGSCALAHEQRLEVAALHVGHRDVEEPVLLAGVVDRDDAGMVERGRELRLAQEPLAVSRLAPSVGDEQLQRGRPPEPHVLGAVDDAHPAAAERLDDPVARELRVDSAVDAHRQEL